jgi:hypothetical protein
MSARLSTVSATRARDEVYLSTNRGECSGHLGGRAECGNGRLVEAGSMWFAV